MACFIFAAGEFYGLHQRPSAEDLVIAADGGYHWCVQEGIVPTLLMGDFDSMNTPLPQTIATLQFPREKDDTDSLLAVKEGLARGETHFHLYGFSGGRIDHTLANLQVLCFLAHHGTTAYLYGAQEVFTALSQGSVTLPLGADTTFSAFCLGETATGVTIQGAKYSLERGTLSAQFPLGISNRAQEDRVHITVEQGTLLIGWLTI